MAHTTKAELAAFWKHFEETHANKPALIENPLLVGTERQKYHNSVVNNPALRTASMKDLHVNDADTSRKSGSVASARTGDTVLEQTI